MDTKEKISQSIKEAMLSKKSLELTVLRGLSSALNNKTIELRATGKEIDEDTTLKIIASEAKKRKDSIEAFKQGDRMDLVEKEQKELDILMSFLPEQMNEDEIVAIVEKIIKNNPEAGKNIGVLMKLVMSEAGNKADGRLVAEIVKRKIDV